MKENKFDTKNVDDEYIDDYVTCYETYSELRVYTGELNPNLVTKFLDLSPSLIIIKDQINKNHINGWFLSSENQVNSKDSRRHIDWVLNKIYSRKNLILELQEKGFRIYIGCYWSSEQGTGGPILSPKQMNKLFELNLDLSFEFYS